MSHDSLPALKGNPKSIFFTDFDGTITLKDSRSMPSLKKSVYDRAKQYAQAMITLYDNYADNPWHLLSSDLDR